MSKTAIQIGAIVAAVYLIVMSGISSWQIATLHYLEQRLDWVQNSGGAS